MSEYKIVLHNGRYAIETSYLHHSDPKQIFITWDIKTGPYCFDQTDIGRDVRHCRDDGEYSVWDIYLNYGNHGTLVTSKYGVNREEPVLKPKGLRSTTETRWGYHGWQKYDRRKGWIAA